MDDAAALQLAADAYSTLKGIDANVAHIGQLLQSHVEQLPELVLPADPEASALALAEGSAGDEGGESWTTVVTANEPLPENWASDLLRFQYMHTVLFVVMAVALLLNLGATLWLAFSDKWRS